MNKIPSSLKLHEDMTSCGQWTIPLWLLSCPLMLFIWSMMSSHICSFYKKLCLRQLSVETCRWMNKKNKAHVCHWSMACNEPTGHPVISYFKREGEGQAGVIRTLGITRRRWLHYWLSLLKVSSGPWHDSRQQKIDTQNMGNLARQMDCKQGHHPVKHLQVAFKTGLNRRGDVQSQIAKPGASTGRPT